MARAKPGENMTLDLAAVVGYLTGTGGFVLIMMTMFWGADSFISKEGRARLVNIIASYEKDGFQRVLPDVLAVIQRYFPGRQALGKHLPNVLLLSALSLAAVSYVYWKDTGGFWNQFNSGARMERNFLAQLAFDGLLKVFIVNCIAMLAYESYMERVQNFGVIACLGLLIMDVVLRLLLFLLVSVVIWTGFVAIGGSFQGEFQAAYAALLETVQGAILFGNLTGTYLYANAIGALPLFLVVALRIISASPQVNGFVRGALFWLPWREKPLRFMLVVTCLLIAFFGFLSAQAMAVIAAALSD
ncbi:MAG: hypothetical protein AAGH57_04935 [Pseudomonadota bacterium]